MRCPALESMVSLQVATLHESLLAVFRPKEVTIRVLTSGVRFLSSSSPPHFFHSQLQGFAIGCVFGLTQQLTLGIRGKNDAVNSGVAGAVVGTLIASRQVNPWRCNMYPIFFGLPAFMVHYGYNKWWDSEYDRAIQLNKTLKEVMNH
jgi:hypothetical protein